MKARFARLVLLACLASSGLAASPRTLPAAVPAGAPVEQPGTRPLTAAEVRASLARLSTRSALVTMRAFSLPAPNGKKPGGVRAYAEDSLVSADGSLSENEPSMAVNPANESIMVVVSHYGPDCRAGISYDGGTSFDWVNNAFILPLVNPGSDFCSDPVVRFSPDGQFAYYAYMSIPDPPVSAQVLLVRADGLHPDVFSDASPYYQIVLSDLGGTVLRDKPWMDVAPFDASNAGLVMVTATRFSVGGDCGIVETSSTSWAAPGSWSPGAGDGYYLYNGTGNSCDITVQGSRALGLAGAYSGQAIACWYNSELDGFLNGVFDIRCRTNPDIEGAPSSWGTEFSAVDNRRYEVPPYLGPDLHYERWAGTMFPALATDPEGKVYIAFAADPTANWIDAESGNVYLARDFPVSTVWPVPIKIGSNPVGTKQLAQGYPTVSARYDAQTNRYVVYVAYMDHSSNNRFYKIVYRRGVRAPGSNSISFAGKKTLSDLISWSDYEFLGDYIDSAVTQRRYHVAWTDRSDALSEFDLDDDILTDYVLP